MRVKLEYGRNGLWIDLPDHNVVILEPEHIIGLQDESLALRTALRAPIGTSPLKELVKPSDIVAIVFSDLTRPQPRTLMLSTLLQEISHVPSDHIILINGLGTHRPNSRTELEEMLGHDLLERYQLVQHDAWDEKTLVYLGRTSFGHDVSVNKAYIEANVKILTGFIEPHFFAGFSGGPKAVLPALADQHAVLANHGAEMIANPKATWGVTYGNPIWEEIREVALLTSPTFLLNVSLNREREITSVYAGDMLQAHQVGTDFVKRVASVGVPGLFDIVITTNSGYPLDLNLYQAVKGMSSAARIVKPGGSIIIATECRDGIPHHGEYEALLREAASPQELLEIVGHHGCKRQDQWQAQIQAQVQLKADVYVYSTNLDEESLHRALLRKSRSVEGTLEILLAKYGSNASIGVLPRGPMTLPYILAKSERKR